VPPRRAIKQDTYDVRAAKAVTERIIVDPGVLFAVDTCLGVDRHRGLRRGVKHRSSGESNTDNLDGAGCHAFAVKWLSLKYSFEAAFRRR
jgi:hypothetical protein